MPDRTKDPVKDPIAQNAETVEQDRAAQIKGDRRGEPSIFTCPDCGGTLWNVDEPELVQFRCHVGHIMTGEVLLAEQTDSAENSLWKAIRTLTDQMILARELAEFARARGAEETAAGFDARAQEAGRQAEGLRQFTEAPHRPETPTGGDAQTP